MTHYRKQITAFTKLFELEIYPSLTATPEDIKRLRVNLIEEEEKELYAAKTRTDRLDAYADLIYVIVGTAVICRIGDPKGEDKSVLTEPISWLIDELLVPVPCDKRLAQYVADCVVTIEKLAEKERLNLLDAFNAVHENNMTKMWTQKQIEYEDTQNKELIFKQKGNLFLVRRKDGKVVKPPQHPKPNLTPFV